MQEIQVWSLCWEDPLETEMATHSTLAWRILWAEEPGGLQPMEWQRITHSWTTDTGLQACGLEVNGSKVSSLAWRWGCGWGLGLQTGIKVLILRSGPGSAEQSGCCPGRRGCLPPGSVPRGWKHPLQTLSHLVLFLYIFLQEKRLYLKWFTNIL